MVKPKKPAKKKGPDPEIRRAQESVFDYCQKFFFHDRFPVMFRAAYDLNHPEPWKYFVEYICRKFLGYDYEKFYQNDLVDELRRQIVCFRAKLPSVEGDDLFDPSGAFDKLPQATSQIDSSSTSSLLSSQNTDLENQKLFFASVSLQPRASEISTLVSATPSSKSQEKDPPASEQPTSKANDTDPGFKQLIVAKSQEKIPASEQPTSNTDEASHAIKKEVLETITSPAESEKPITNIPNFCFKAPAKIRPMDYNPLALKRKIKVSPQQTESIEMQMDSVSSEKIAVQPTSDTKCASTARKSQNDHPTPLTPKSVEKKNKNVIEQESTKTSYDEKQPKLKLKFKLSTKKAENPSTIEKKETPKHVNDSISSPKDGKGLKIIFKNPDRPLNRLQMQTKTIDSTTVTAPLKTPLPPEIKNTENPVNEDDHVVVPMNIDEDLSFAIDKVMQNKLMNGGLEYNPSGDIFDEIDNALEAIHSGKSAIQLAANTKQEISLEDSLLNAENSQKPQVSVKLEPVNSLNIFEDNSCDAWFQRLEKSPSPKVILEKLVGISHLSPYETSKTPEESPKLQPKSSNISDKSPVTAAGVLKRSSSLLMNLLEVNPPPQTSSVKNNEKSASRILAYQNKVPVCDIDLTISSDDSIADEQIYKKRKIYTSPSKTNEAEKSATTITQAELREIEDIALISFTSSDSEKEMKVGEKKVVIKKEKTDIGDHSPADKSKNSVGKSDDLISEASGMISISKEMLRDLNSIEKDESANRKLKVENSVEIVLMEEAQIISLSSDESMESLENAVDLQVNKSFTIEDDFEPDYEPEDD